MFGRQWFGAGSQSPLDEEALIYESLLRSRQYGKAVDLANRQINTLAVEHSSYNYWRRQYLRGLRLKQRNNTNSIISVFFSGFWPGFRQEDNELLNMLKHVGILIGSEIVLSSNNPDLLIFSCFGDPGLNRFPSSTRILYLGENVRPDYTSADYSLTFDVSDYCGRNIYLPLWLLRSTKYATRHADYAHFDPECLGHPQKVNNKNDSIVYIGNNNTSMRVEAIKQLKSLGMTVECFGSQTRPVQDKIKTLNEFRYSLCFENSYTPGYVTEKIFDAFAGGTIPIYWGGLSSEIFNVEKLFICDPYKSVSLNIHSFIKWKQVNSLLMMPPLLRPGAFSKIDSAVILSISKLLMDLF